MCKFWKWTLASAFIGCGTMGVVASLMQKEAKAVEIITHWVPHEVYGVPGEPDNNGKVFFSGLGAKYMGYPKHENPPPYPGKYSKFWRTLPAYRYYIPDYTYNRDEVRPSNPIKGTFQNEQCVACHSVMTPGM